MNWSVVVVAFVAGLSAVGVFHFKSKADAVASEIAAIHQENDRKWAFHHAIEQKSTLIAILLAQDTLTSRRAALDTMNAQMMDIQTGFERAIPDDVWTLFAGQIMDRALESGDYREPYFQYSKYIFAELASVDGQIRTTWKDIMFLEKDVDRLETWELVCFLSTVLSSTLSGVLSARKGRSRGGDTRAGPEHR